jgi:hypothetical protein
MEFKRFDRSDWDAFAGAEPFKDGSNPWIAYESNYVVVADASGITVSRIDSEYGEEFEAHLSIDDNEILCMRIARELDDNKMGAQVREYGFMILS